MQPLETHHLVEVLDSHDAHFKNLQNEIYVFTFDIHRIPHF